MKAYQFIQYLEQDVEIIDNKWSYDKYNNMSTQQINREHHHSVSLDKQYSSIERADKTKYKIRRKIGQLENKACFFEGQLNPLAFQNKMLKDKLVELSRKVSSASDLLRNLLPLDTSPARKLKIQMANLEQVSAMIKQDWLMMKQQITKYLQEIKDKDAAMADEQLRNKKISQEYLRVISQMKNKYQAQIQALNKKNQELVQQIALAKEQHQKEKQLIIDENEKKMQHQQRLKKEMQRSIQQFKQRIAYYEKTTQRLKDEIASNLQQFEKSKQTIKQIYEELMQNKINQQAQEFEFLLKQKDDERIRMMEEMLFQEEQLKKKLEEKISQLGYLSGVNDKLKEEIGAVKDQMWANKIELDACKKQMKELETKLVLESENVKSLKIKIQKKQEQILGLENKIKSSEEKYHKDMTEKILEIQNLNKKLNNQSENHQKIIAEAELKLQQVRRKLRQTTQKFDEMVQEERKKQSQVFKKIQQEKRLMQKQLDEANDKLCKKDEQMIALKREYQKQMKKMEQLHESKIKKISVDYQKKISLITNQNQEKIKGIKRDYDIKISQIEINNNEYVRKLITEQNVKLYEQENKYRLLQQSSQQQMTKMARMELDMEQAAAQSQKLKTKCQQMEQNYQKTLQQHKKALQEQKLQSQRILEQEKQKILDKMQEQIKMFKKAMDEKQAEFKEQLTKIQQSMQNQINMLKQTNVIEQIQNKYNNIITKMKQQLDQEVRRLKQMNESDIKKLRETHQLQAKRMQETYQNDMKKCLSEHEDALQRLTEQYHKQLNILSQKLQFDMSKLNEELLEEKQAHTFTKMTREQKIQYLVDKINAYKNQMTQKENRIFELQFELDRKNKQLQKIQEIIQERVKEKKMEFDREALQLKAYYECEVKKNQSQCWAKVKKVQTERVSFTQSIYNQFQEIKNRYDKEMQRMVRRYEELEKIFEERPSRAEDLSKIKELIEQKTKMDMEIKQCKKKVKQANEIVRYLNLSLQNYKETYDIFGPGGEPLSPQRKYSIQACSPIKSLLSQKRQPTPLQLESSDRIYNSGEREKRNQTQGSQLCQFRLFPSLQRHTSEVIEEDQQSEAGMQQTRNKEQVAPKQESILRNLRQRQRRLVRNRTFEDDKSDELKNNASIFINMLGNSDQKLPAEVRKPNKEYGRRMGRRNTVSISYDKRIQIKSSSIVFES